MFGSIVKGAADIAKKAVSGAGSSNWLPIAGNLASGALGLAGGVYSANKSAQVANNVNLLNYKQAKEFAQNQIQWRVADARKAGLHPLVALGISPQSPPAAAIGGDVSGLGQGLSDMGQNISRAIDSYQTREDRMRDQAKAEALQDLQYKLQLDKFALDQKETASRVALNDARTAVEKAQLANMIKGASVRAQPRVVHVGTSKRFGVHKLAGERLMGVMVGPNGETIPAPTEATAQRGQNLWGLLEAYGYGSWLYKKFKDNASKYGRFMRQSGLFEHTLNQW